MTLRDLTPKQARKLQKECARMLTHRNKSRDVDDTYVRSDYETAFSDGVRATLELIVDKRWIIDRLNDLADLHAEGKTPLNGFARFLRNTAKRIESQSL